MERKTRAKVGMGRKKREDGEKMQKGRVEGRVGKSKSTRVTGSILGLLGRMLPLVPARGSSPSLVAREISSSTALLAGSEDVDEEGVTAPSRPEEKAVTCTAFLL